VNMDKEGNAPQRVGSPEKRRPRWGLRTLGFLGLALLAIVTSASLGHHTVGTMGSLLFGLIGAAYCSVKGLRVALDSDVFRMLAGRRRRR
jgi:peptidoglycan/LPS O-acetylase OafA/YrhL